MQDTERYFTTQMAVGRAFCDRDSERLQLQTNLAKGNHTVVVAPRRYGKTSLVCYVLNEMKADYAEVDLFCAVSAKSVCNKIAGGTSQLLKSIVPLTTKTLMTLGEYFQNASFGIKAGQLEFQLGLGKLGVDPVEELLNMLVGLEKVAAKYSKRMVIFLDEFQDLVKVDKSREIQAVIRAVAQKTQHLVFVFSGSSRYMLRKIFDDRNEPLYMLCDIIHLGRIDREHFTVHLQKLAKKKWNEGIGTDILSYILDLTELHSYYVNLLGDKLWDYAVPPATKAQIDATWGECMLSQKDKLIADLEPLSANKIKVLNVIAMLGEVMEPNGQEFLGQVRMPLGTVQKVVTYLMDNDYIYRNRSGGIVLVDPLLKKFIREKIEYI